jgi:hypothetical protein
MTVVTPTTTTITYGQSATVTATVSSNVGTPPDGSVQFQVNGVNYGSPVALSGNTAQLVITEPAGGYVVTAEYLSDTNFAGTLPAAETSAQLTVSPVATATTVTPDTASITYGQSAIFTATVSSNLGTPPDGSVQFLVNGASYGSPVTLNGNTAQLAIAEPVDSYTVTAQYTGDANYASTLPADETSASLTVKPYAFSYTIGNVSQTYGSPADLAADLPATIATGVNGENLAITYNSTGDTVAAPVGQYAITATLSNGTGHTSNYRVTLTNGTLTVNPGSPLIGHALSVKGFERSRLSQVALLTFTQAPRSLPPSLFHVTITWGDGTAPDTTTGQVTQSSGVYVVSGSHTYLDESYKRHGHRDAISVQVTDGTNSVTIATTATILEELLPNGTRGTAHERFISEVYRDLLGRKVDMPSVLHWSHLLDIGVSRLVVVRQIESVLQAPFYHYLVEQLDQQFLHRSAAGDPQTAKLVSLLIHGATVEHVEAMILSSPEYLLERTNGTFAGWLTAVYGDLFHRPVDPVGLSRWTAYAVGKSLTQVALGIMTAPPLPGSRANEYRLDLVRAFYQRYLDRSGQGDQGARGWAVRLQAGVRYQVVVAEIIAEQIGNEFFDKVAP